MQETQDINLKLKKIKKVLMADAIFGSERLKTIVKGIYASDLMSDVLAYGETDSVLLTGLCTNQAVLSAYMADFIAVVFLRGKIPTEDILKFAKEKEIIILSTKADMFEACVKIAKLFSDQLPDEDVLVSADISDKDTTIHEFNIDGHDFASSGMVSSQVKSIVKDIGYDPQLVRRIAIATYEAEMNVVMHAVSAKVTITAGDEEIVLIIDDKGKGIPDVDQAMRAGYSTATDDQRAMGFGAGMGLPNIEKNSDDLNIISEIDEGTRIEMRFFV